MEGMSRPSDGAPLFEALIVPHRSLSPTGLRILLGVLAGIGAVIGSAFWLLGAWPVTGFSGVEILIAVLLLRLNVRGARETELVLLSEYNLRVIRTDARGRRQERDLDPSWLNVVLQDRPGRVPALWLATRRHREEIARQLGEAEKRELAQALDQALRKRRMPVFDNPQLRD
jgi:uncharacterized membrane protein